ncbi:hypothetical protein ACFOSH_19290 [Amycolatopsis speibonae]|uniref:Uncharacterized protein n=1 Tax=Amycolatopsis speibonae TaxID=1450224 RepID=A0ABV7NXM6_9PSEU
MPKNRKPRQRDPRSCLAGGQEGNKVFGEAGSRPPQQPTGPTRPGGGYRSTRFCWPPDLPEQDDEV